MLQANMAKFERAEQDLNCQQPIAIKAGMILYSGETTMRASDFSRNCLYIPCCTQQNCIKQYKFQLRCFSIGGFWLIAVWKIHRLRLIMLKIILKAAGYYERHGN